MHSVIFSPIWLRILKINNLAAINDETDHAVKCALALSYTYYKNFKEDHNIQISLKHTCLSFRQRLVFKDSAVTAFLEPPRQTLNKISVYRTKCGRELCK